MTEITSMTPHTTSQELTKLNLQFTITMACAKRLTKALEDILDICDKSQDTKLKHEVYHVVVLALKEVQEVLRFNND